MKDIVYKVPGNNFGPKGKTYNWKPVNSKDEFKAAIKDGWFDTLEEAIEGKSKVVEDVEDDSAPTREEMNNKAKDLGIQHAKNVSDKTLLRLITDKLSVG